MTERKIQTISVPLGGKMDLFLQDARKAGKNLSALVCGIVERHETLYDDNLTLEEDLRHYKRLAAKIHAAAINELEKDGSSWVLHIPDYEARGEGIMRTFHFRMVDRDQSDIDS